MRGNRLDLIRGERVELTTVTLVPSNEIGSLMRGRTGGEGEDEEKEMRESTENGVSVEGEYTFTQAVGKFTRGAEREGYYKGLRVGNVKEQLQMRARQEKVGSIKKFVVGVGASEMGRIMGEIDEVGSQVLLTGPMIKVQGDWTDEKLAEVMEAVDKGEIPPSHILIGGPGNAMVIHGRADGRGLGGEKKLVVEGEGKIRVEYHLTEPVRRSIRETEELVGKVHGLMRGLRKLCPGTQIIYRFPRHVEQCCREAGHMRQEDIGAMHVERKEFDKAVKDKVGAEFECWEWHDVLGVGKDLTLLEMRDRGIVGRDGVHMERV
jgi:hypothetical protein